MCNRDVCDRCNLILDVRNIKIFITKGYKEKVCKYCVNTTLINEKPATK